ncbi:signal peptidase II [Georgenia sp. EYE_87]|uniref:signal peptidase II n=1 Tax=Georgenia sp. EYE_87 TaxID=2853448 RepID=UPI002002D0A7|nr:signal peptidase II [Georgenia sp. EYE_87]MCK6212609.1 signal peptidase II [Georgenia sp. EYE_87]
MESQPETPQQRARERGADVPALAEETEIGPTAPHDGAPVPDPGPTAPDDGAPAVPARRRRRLITLLLGLTVAIVAVDQVTKHLAEARLVRGELVPLLGDVLGLQLVYNPGAAFSFATGMTWVFTIIMVVVAVAVLRVSRRLGSTAWAVALGMLLGGCLGNLYDRLFRDPGFAVGHVVDFISYNGWFVGNVADIAIVGAAALVALLAVRGREVDGSLAVDVERRRRGARA